MQRDLGFYLIEVLKPIAYVKRRSAEGSLERFQSDEDYRFAIERNLSMIGETAARLRMEFPAESSSIRNLRGIVGFRNIAIHDYWGLDHSETWSILTSHIDPLEEDVKRLIETLPDTPL